MLLGTYLPNRRPDIILDPDAGSWHIDVLMFKNLNEFVDFRYCVSIPRVLKQLFLNIKIGSRQP